MSDVVGYRRPYFNTQPSYLYPGYRSTIKRAPARPLVLLPHTLSETTGPMMSQLAITISPRGIRASPWVSALSFRGGCSMKTPGRWRTP